MRAVEKEERDRLNGVHQNSSIEYIGAANVVIFGPDDLKIIKGGPGERRKFLDLEISAVHEGYRKDLAQYRRILTQRNAFLKDKRYSPKSVHGRAAIDAWDEQLISAGARIMVKRAQVIEELSHWHKLHIGKYPPMVCLNLSIARRFVLKILRMETKH